MKSVRNQRWPSKNHGFLNVTDAPNGETFVRLSARTSIRLDVARVVEKPESDPGVELPALPEMYGSQTERVLSVICFNAK